MLKTGMYNKLEEMKNGGYTLFSDKTRKMLLAMGLSLLSIGTLSQVANAELVGNVQFKKTGGENLTEGTYRYQIELTESNTDRKLAGIYDSTGTVPVTLHYGTVAGKQTATVVIEVPTATTQVMIKNDNATPGEDDTKLITLSTDNVDNVGPEADEKTFIKYNTEEGKYLQVRLTDDTKIYRIEDEDGHDRVLLKEKEQDKDVTVKYVLQDDELVDDDVKFIVYDILGNPSEIKLADAKVQALFNARNLEGTRIAIDVTREFTETVVTDNTDPENPVTTQVPYALTGVQTGAGQEITLQGADNDIYVDLPQGTTKLILTYTNPNDANDTKTVILPLILDKTGPDPVAYSTTAITDGEDPQGNDITAYTVTVAESGGRARAYFNKDKGKGIVEVKDIQSGISKIVTLTGTTGNYEEETVVFTATDLSTTVLWLFNVTQDTTAVRVYDGVGCYVDIELTTDDNTGEGTTVATIRKEEDGTYTLIAQDTQAGLGYIERDGEESSLANFKSSVGFILPEKTPRNADQKYYHGGHYEDGVHVAGTEDKIYTQYTLEKFQMTIDDQGKPIIHIYDALGNESLVDFDQFAFICHYATYNEEDSLSISVTESRGIWKIVTTIRDKNAPEMPTIPSSPEPSPAPEMPSQAKPATTPTPPATPIPTGNNVITPPEEGTTAYERWNDWVEAGLQKDDPRAPQMGQSGYELWLKYVDYLEQQDIVKAWEDYQAELDLLEAWKEYELWQAWDTYHTWRETYANTYTLEVFAEGEGEPEEFARTYQVPEGIVEEVRIYNTRGDETLYNTITTQAQPNKINCGQLIDIANVIDADRVQTTAAKTVTEGEGANEKVIGATLTAKFGIKKVTYSDGCVIQFYDELPTELFVNCKVVDAQGQDAILTAVVMDAIGDTATITESGVTCSYTSTPAGETNSVTTTYYPAP